jgi:hypothetical protein
MVSPCRGMAEPCSCFALCRVLRLPQLRSPARARRASPAPAPQRPGPLAAAARAATATPVCPRGCAANRNARAAGSPRPGPRSLACPPQPGALPHGPPSAAAAPRRRRWRTAAQSAPALAPAQGSSPRAQASCRLPPPSETARGCAAPCRGRRAPPAGCPCRPRRRRAMAVSGVEVRHCPRRARAPQCPAPRRRRLGRAAGAARPWACWPPPAGWAPAAADLPAAPPPVLPDYLTARGQAAARPADHATARAPRQGPPIWRQRVPLPPSLAPPQNPAAPPCRCCRRRLRLVWQRTSGCRHLVAQSFAAWLPALQPPPSPPAASGPAPAPAAAEPAAAAAAARPQWQV